MPEDIAGLLRSAEAANTAGRLPEVARLTDRVLAMDPDNVRATLLRGVSASGMGNAPAAIRAFRRVIELEPDTFDARIWLGGILQLEGAVAEAMALAEEAARLMPGVAAGHLLLGRCHLRSGQAEEAIRAFQTAISVEPASALLYHLLGQAQKEAGKLPEAAASFRHAIELAPNIPDSFIAFSTLLMWSGERMEGVACLRRAYNLEPNTPRGLTQLAKAQSEEGDLIAAESTLRRASQLFPQAAAPVGVLGTLLWQAGRFDEAIRALERAISLRPQAGQAYCDLVHCRRIAASDQPLIDRMESLARTDNLPSDDRRFLHYALGKAYDDLGEFGKAIRHFDEANRLMSIIAHPRFDPSWYRAEFGAIIKRFSQERMAAGNKFGASSDLPVLIVGMIRSGTTLTEQILSSHPEIVPGGELPFWTRMPESNALAFSRAPFDLEKIGRLGTLNLEYLSAFRAGRLRITDKMPLNFVYLGLIHLALPHARIIHCRRNSLDNAVSMYTTAFPEPVGFLHRRENIVAYYREYLRLMKHWREVLPASRFLEIDYEDLVCNREAVMRRIIDFVGLEWDDACLHHETAAREVRTPSAWQVRQPIYRSALNRWHNYEPWLGEFREILEP